MLTPYISSMNVVFFLRKNAKGNWLCERGIPSCVSDWYSPLYHTFTNYFAHVHEPKKTTHTQENETEREKKNQAKREIIYMCYWCGSKFRKGFSNNLTKSAFRGAYRYTQPTIWKYVFLFVKWFRLKEFRPNMRTRNWSIHTHRDNSFSPLCYDWCWCFIVIAMCMLVSHKRHFNDEFPMDR